MNKQKVGIFGGGVLGNAMKQYFKEAKIYDKYNDSDSLEDVLGQDIIFICVPTPYTNDSPRVKEGGEAGKGFDLTEMDDVFNNLANLKDKIIVIRSTVLPGTTKDYQEKYPELKVLFNPEFLTEATAVEDFLKPDKQIIGYTQKSQPVAKEILAILPDAPFKQAMGSNEAEMIKYMVNNYYALKVIFANQIYDICQVSGIDYEKVAEGFAADKRISDSHLKVIHKGYRGFGGKCLRKDVYSLIDFAKKNGVDFELLKTAKEINLKLNEGK